MRETLAHLERLKHEVGGADETTWANVCVSDGASIVPTRYASPADARAQSLYVGQAGGFVAGDEYCGAVDPEDDAATLVASEALFDDDRVWQAVPRDHVVAVDPDGDVTIEPLALDVGS